MSDCPHDSDCVFCKIVSGEIPCAKLAEGESYLAFLDVGPVADGHALLIPKGHYETLAELPPATAAEVLGQLPALARAVGQGVGVEGMNVLQNNGRVAGQVVPHVHFHIIPRTAGDRFSFNWPAASYEDDRMSVLAERIRGHLR